MHTKSGVEEYVDAVKEIKKQGGQIAFGGKVGKGFFIYFPYIVLKFDVFWRQVLQIIQSQLSYEDSL